VAPLLTVLVIAIALIQNERPPYEECPSPSIPSSDSSSDEEGPRTLDIGRSSDGNPPNLSTQSNSCDTSSSPTIIHHQVFSGELEPEIQQIYKSIGAIVDQLYTMAMIIRQPIPLDEVTKAVSIDVSHYTAHDLNHVRECFPTADADLQNRLARAITQRRRNLIYRQRHRIAIALPVKSHSELNNSISRTAGQQNSNDDNLNQEKRPDDRQGHSSKDATSKGLPSTKATTFVQPALTTVPSLDDAVSDIGTQSSYTSTLSATDDVFIPPCPVDLEVNDGVGFECPYCCYIVQMKNAKAWRFVRPTYLY